MAGLERQDKEFWEFVKRYDFISLCETWLEEKGWKRIKGKLPKSHKRICRIVKREKKRGKAKEGFLVERRKDWREEGSKLGREIGEEMLMSRIKNKKDRDVRIVSIYNSGKKWKRLSKRHGKIEGRKLLY